MSTVCQECKHGSKIRGGEGYFCNIAKSPIEGEWSLCNKFEFKERNSPGQNCDLYGKACMTCSGCPAEPTTEEDESEVWG